MKKILEVDIVRAVAILAVLFIHGTSEATVEVTEGHWTQVSYLAINKLSNFAVPTFLFVSGLVMFYRYFPVWHVRETWTFYRKRLQYIVIPYLIWSFIYYVYNPWIEPEVDVAIDWPDFWQQLRWADTGYHLYFIIIILQFYIAFPVLISLAKRFRGFALTLPLWGIAIQAAAFLYHRLAGPIPHRASLAITYFGVFCIGAWIGMHYERALAWMTRFRGVLYPLTVLSGIALFLFYWLDQLRWYSADQALMEATMDLYSVLAGTSLLLIGRRMLDRSRPLTSALLSFGAVSFGIYFIHPALLTAWRTFIHYPPEDPMYHAAVLGGIVLVLVVPWLISRVLKRIPGSWLLLGR